MADENTTATINTVEDALAEGMRREHDSFMSGASPFFDMAVSNGRMDALLSACRAQVAQGQSSAKVLIGDDGATSFYPNRPFDITVSEGGAERTMTVGDDGLGFRVNREDGELSLDLILRDWSALPVEDYENGLRHADELVVDGLSQEVPYHGSSEQDLADDMQAEIDAENAAERALQKNDDTNNNYADAQPTPGPVDGPAPDVNQGPVDTPQDEPEPEPEPGPEPELGDEIPNGEPSGKKDDVQNRPDESVAPQVGGGGGGGGALGGLFQGLADVLRASGQGVGSLLRNDNPEVAAARAQERVGVAQANGMREAELTQRHKVDREAQSREKLAKMGFTPEGFTSDAGNVAGNEASEEGVVAGPAPDPLDTIADSLADENSLVPEILRSQEGIDRAVNHWAKPDFKTEALSNNDWRCFDALVDQAPAQAVLIRNHLNYSPMSEAEYEGDCAKYQQTLAAIEEFSRHPGAQERLANDAVRTDKLQTVVMYADYLNEQPMNRQDTSPTAEPHHVLTGDRLDELSLLASASAGMANKERAMQKFDQIRPASLSARYAADFSNLSNLKPSASLPDFMTPRVAGEFVEQFLRDTDSILDSSNRATNVQYPLAGRNERFTLKTKSAAEQLDTTMPIMAALSKNKAFQSLIDEHAPEATQEGLMSASGRLKEAGNNIAVNSLAGSKERSEEAAKDMADMGKKIVNALKGLFRSVGASAAAGPER